jgi:hypothetical protein
MPYLAKLEQAQEDARLRQQRTGSQAMILGFVILGFAAVLGIYNFADLREGTRLMLSMSGGLAFIGLVLIAFGEYKRAESV